ncbi:MAG: FGGY-family carbohydrate kinase [Thermodesulfobacteriota bacterium]
MHAAVVRRAVSMLRRVSNNLDSAVFAGGVAKKPCMREFLADSLDIDVLIPKTPQMTGALGAALLAQER